MLKKLFKKYTVIFAFIFLSMISICNPAVMAFNEYDNLAEKFKLSAQQFEKVLTRDSSQGVIKMIPLNSSVEHLHFFKKLLAFSDPEYIKYFWTGKLRTEDEVEMIVKSRLKDMWEEPVPVIMTFLVTLNDRFVGMCNIYSLNFSAGEQPKIGRVILQKYSGKGLGYHCTQATISLLRYLRSEGKYSFRELHSTVHPENIASMKSTMKSGFISDGEVTHTEWGPRLSFVYKFDN